MHVRAAVRQVRREIPGRLLVSRSQPHSPRGGDGGPRRREVRASMRPRRLRRSLRLPVRRQPREDRVPLRFSPRSRGGGGGAGAVKLGRDERRPLGKLGEPSCVKVTRVVRVSFRVDWEYDGHAFYAPDDDPVPVRKRRARFVQNKAAAYRIAAWRLIFARRDRYSKGFGEGGKSTGCKLCDENPVRLPSECGPGGCRYHDDETARMLCERLAHRMRRKDEIAAPPPAAPPQGETR